MQQIIQYSPDPRLAEAAFADLQAALPGMNCTATQAIGSKRAVKTLRKQPDAAVLLAAVERDNLDEFIGLCETIRDRLRNGAVRIVACTSDCEIPPATADRARLDAVVELGEHYAGRLSVSLGAQLRQARQDARKQIQHRAEIDLLSALARFSRLEMKLRDCLKEFARATAIITNAIFANVVVVPRDGTLRRSRISYASDDVDLSSLLRDNRHPKCPLLEQTINEARLQVQLDPDESMRETSRRTGLGELGGRFVYPLCSGGRVICLVECWLPPDALDDISVDLVRLIEEASEQFGLLFDRKEAESKLRKQYQRLQLTLSELQQAQQALVHAEKLASLGELAAGIAHEINNPIAFVMGNFSPLDEYVDGMSRMLELHAEFMSALESTEVDEQAVRSEIVELDRELDTEFVLEDVRSLVQESQEGLKRVKEIVQSLNEFSRRDEVKTAPADINDGIETTLRILQNELKRGVSVTRELSELPPVNCQIGLVNQVLLNLVKNAIQAMGGCDQSTSALFIRTVREDECVCIYVSDSGPGIPADVLDKIFDPFFTTKGVGEGTGLGLSLSHGIAVRHGGDLQVADTSPTGTTFKLILPIEGPPADEQEAA